MILYHQLLHRCVRIIRIHGSLYILARQKDFWTSWEYPLSAVCNVNSYTKNTSPNKISMLQYVIIMNVLQSRVKTTWPLFTKRLTARFREVSKPQYSGLDFSNRSEIWRAPRPEHCRDACQISERLSHSNIKSRGFETSWDLAIRCPSALWMEVLSTVHEWFKYKYLLSSFYVSATNHNQWKT